MKKVGREVLFLATGQDNPRNGEGAMIRRRDGSILLIYTAYMAMTGMTIVPPICQPMFLMTKVRPGTVPILR